MFMSTRYSKRTSEASSRKIFTVSDTLPKLCEYLTCEFSCSKLITCKYKDFISSKIKFEQKTRLNNAIWRAWHIQYKLKKKARFLQFAAPFSDESTHSTSQAVILDGKYWKRRLDKVSREHKKWRRDLEEKLLRTGGLSREQLEVETSDTDTDDDIDVETPVNSNETNPLSNEPLSTSSSHDSFETLRAMNAHPDTLFSCVEKQDSSQDNDDQDLTLFKDSSGMIQPTLVQLNPCFDELMENFDFLFTDINSSTPYPPSVGDTSSADLPQMLLNMKDDQFLSTLNEKKTVDTLTGLGDLNPHLNALPNHLSQTILPFHHSNEERGSTGAIRPVKELGLNTPKPDIHTNYDELPPQLQAPNLTATLQAAMSNRPKPLTKNKSDTNLSAMSKRNKKDSAGGPTAKRIRRNTSNTSLPDVTKQVSPNLELRNRATSSRDQHTITQQQQPHHQQHQKQQQQQQQQQPEMINISSSRQIQLTTNVQTRSSFVQSSSSVRSAAAALQSYASAPAPVLSTSTPQKIKTNNSPQPFHPYTRIASLSNDFVHSIRVPSHPASSIAKIAPMPSTNQQLLYPSPSVLVVPPQRSVHPNNSSSSTSQQQQPQQRFEQPHQHQQQLQVPQQLPLPSAQQLNKEGSGVISATSASATEQLSALSQLIQNSPVQTGGEVTMSYLQMLQQQLNVIMKQQEEQIQLKYQLQQQAKKILHLQEKQSQHQQHLSITTCTTCPTNNISTDPMTIRGRLDATTSTQYVVGVPFTGKAIPVGEISRPNTADTGCTSTTSVLRLRMKDFPSVLPTAISIPPCTSPKSFSKSKSLVSRLHAMEDLQPSHDLEQFTKVITCAGKTDSMTSSSSTPTTLDSAMALVSLRHGTKTVVDLNAGSSKEETASPLHYGSSVASSAKVYADVPVQSVEPKCSEPDQDDISEQRRKCHLSAEQKRRGIIKNAFEELGRIIPFPNSEDGKASKLSNAAILEQTCEHIIYLQNESTSNDARIDKIREEIDAVNSAISKYQSQLPATGVSVQRQNSDNNLHKTFFAFCKELIYINSKSWLFCILMRPLFESFNKAVNTKTIEDFLNSFRQWVDEHCTLPVLRPLVLDLLTKLSVSSSVLEDPGCINALARSALHCDDPTVICVNSDGGESSSSDVGDTRQWEESFWHK